MLQNKSLISNKIIYYDIVDKDPRNMLDDELSEKEKKKKDKYELLEKMGVNCEIIVKKNDYKSGYINILEKVDSDIEQKKWKQKKLLKEWGGLICQNTLSMRLKLLSMNLIVDDSAVSVPHVAL